MILYFPGCMATYRAKEIAKSTIELLKRGGLEFELLGESKVSDQDAWAHVAICGDEVLVRELNALSVYRWDASKSK